MGANRDMVRGLGVAGREAWTVTARKPTSGTEIVHTSPPADMRTRSVDERRPAWARTATWFAGSA
jgi:hypothetical protein